MNKLATDNGLLTILVGKFIRYEPLLEYVTQGELNGKAA